MTPSTLYRVPYSDVAMAVTSPFAPLIAQRGDEELPSHGTEPERAEEGGLAATVGMMRREQIADDLAAVDSRPRGARQLQGVAASSRVTAPPA